MPLKKINEDNKKDLEIVNNGDTGLSARTKINLAITAINDGTGPTGPAGTDGSVGPTGPAGSDGLIGPTGPGSGSSAVQLLSSIISFDMNSIDDRLVTLSGGTQFIITDCLITNSSTSIDTAAGFQLWTGPSQSGDNPVLGALSGGGMHPKTDVLSHLVLPSNYINASTFCVDLSNSGFLTLSGDPVSVGVSLYASLSATQSIPELGTATVDVYIYGYVLIS